ncbi:uncharacterized protein V1518DRAFT_412801 [Limtongia smithiae]|uniref:uncharacterized protein n=1 Tax=Limtongia smithiae TaxID=1125753 RepID=UPI0034CDFB62
MAATPRSRHKSTQQLNYEQYIARDALQAAAFKDHTDRHIAFLRQKRQEIEYYESLYPIRRTDPGVVFGDGYAGNGNGYTNRTPAIVDPRDRVRPRVSRELRISRADMRRQSEALEELVPVRLDFEFESGRLRDTFTFNRADRAVPLDVFSENLCEDYGIPLHYAPQIRQAIEEQVNDFQPHIFDPALAKPVDPTLPYTAYKDDDMRIAIKLDITVGQHNLVDQFEWDINEPQNNPEDFARKLCQELSLPPEFLTAIAHAIREQAQLFTKSLVLVHHPFDGRTVEDEEIYREMCQPVTDLVRAKSALRDYTPLFYELSEAELGKADKDSERENRWKRRQGRAVGRRGGMTLPDLREPVRTFRTPIISSVLPCAVVRKEPSPPPPPQMLDLDDMRYASGSPNAAFIQSSHSTRRTRHNTDTAAVHYQQPQQLPATPTLVTATIPHSSPASFEQAKLIVRLKGGKIRDYMLANPAKFVR